MKNEKITVVVAVYNIEKYVSRCLHSIVNQTYENLEIILIDDGSTDSCPDILDKFAMQDSRVKVLHKANEGLGMARNEGIRLATGVYICFFDGDDYIAKDAIKKVYDAITKEKAEIVVFGFQQVSSEGNVKETVIPVGKRKCYVGNQVQDELLPNLLSPDLETGEDQHFWMSAWAAFYSLNLIRKMDWKFVSEREIISEDVYSLLSLYHDVKRVVVLSEAIYYYCENDTSLTHVYRKDRYEKNKYFYDSCISLCNELGYGKNIQDRLAFPYLSNIIMTLKLVVLSDMDRKRKSMEIRGIVCDQHIQYVLKKRSSLIGSRKRRILLRCMRMRLWHLCYWIVIMQCNEGE